MPRNRGSKEPRTQSKTQFKGPRKPQTDRSRTKPETRTDSRSRTKPETRTDSRSRTKPETRTDSRSRTKPENRTESRGRTKPETRTDSRSRTKPETRTESRGRTKPETRTESRSRTKPETRTESRSRMKPESRYRTEQPKRAGKPSSSRPRTALRAAGRRPTRKPAPKAPEAPHQDRLQKIIATAGITSRRKAEELILEGRVTVNGKTITELGAKADPSSDRIEVDGKRISVKGPKVYLLLNKPKGYISSVSDEHNRPVVTQLVSRVRARVYPVGRLDYDAEGVLLLTNDGDLSNKLIHPTFQVPKTYLVKVKGIPPKEKLEKLEKGVFLEDGRTLPAKAKFVRATEENSWIELTVFEGRNHLVKRMCMAIGHPVQKLKRVDFAGIKVGKLKPGEFRPLTEKELETLKGLGKD